VSDLDRILAEQKPPTLSPHFSQRVMANLPQQQPHPESPPRWLRAYWILFGFFVIWQMGQLPLPWWSAVILTPTLFGVLAAPGNAWRRMFGPMLR
jgi:hypothetical protein